MSGEHFHPPREFTFPSLAAQQPSQYGAQQPFDSVQAQLHPFEYQPSRTQAMPPAQPQYVQLQAPIKPQSSEPLTARSTVIHASSRSAPQQLPQQQMVQGTQQQRPTASPVRKPAPVTQAEGRRNKVPLEKGFSQVSWMKLTKSGEDLTGGQGRRRDITMEEVKQHRSPDDAWMVLHGKVYNITPYLRFHPGGADVLMKGAGKDGTPLFNKYHPWVNASALLEKCLIGSLLKPEGEQEAEQRSTQSLKSKLSQLFK